ncbi:MAG TPA: hypothetical protein VGK67_05580 [Myxococcales bacterium]|jgi:hypothetical protein
MIRRFATTALTVCLGSALALPGVARAAGTSAVTLSPVCVTKAGASLFLAEQSDNCSGAQRRCRGVRWAWATLAKGWEFETLGDGAEDEAASPESNAGAVRQLFKAPSAAAGACERYLRAAKLREPNLADSDIFFSYSVERGALTLHWADQKVAVAGDVRLSRVAWCPRGCAAGGSGPKAEARAIEPGYTLVEKKAGKETTAELVPTLSFASGADAVLGFPEPSQGTGDSGFVVLQVPEARLREAQAKLLHQDAQKLLAKSGDLLSESKATGLLDASLQLNGADAEARLDYARILARQGEAASAVRELEKLRSSKDLKSRLESDKAFLPVKGKDAYKKFLDGIK